MKGERALEKRLLRGQARQARGELDPLWRARAAVEATRLALELVEREGAATVALFASFDSEIDTHPLIGGLLARGCRVALPRVSPSSRGLELRAVGAFPGDCRAGPFGILEPDPLVCGEELSGREVDLAFVPGLLFDAEGWRLGYGGGYYDRLLSSGRPRLVIGLAYSTQLVDVLPHDSWDSPVDAILTERSLSRVK